MNTFFDRLGWAAHGRRFTPWLSGLGWSNGVISALPSGRVPGPDRLLLLAEREGLSIDWLLRGTGSAYRVTYCPRHEDFTRAALGRRPSQRWHWVYCDLGQQQAVAARIAGGAEPGDDPLRVWVGAIEPRFLDAIPYEFRHQLSAALAQRLAAGSLGYYELVGKPPAPLRAILDSPGDSSSTPAAADAAAGISETAAAYRLHRRELQQRWETAGEALQAQPAEFEHLVAIAERLGGIPRK